MSERRYRLYCVRLWLVVSTLILFSLCVAIVIDVWFPVLPEAAAVTIDSDSSSQWSQYIRWHESWRYVGANNDASSSCLH